MSRHDSELTDAQWEHIAPLLPEPQPSPQGGPKSTPNRPCCEGLLWRLRTGAWGKDFPRQDPSPRTCWRRLRDGEEPDVWLKGWRAFLAPLEAQGQLDGAEAFGDGSFAPAQKGGPGSAQRNGAKGRRGWWSSTAKVFRWEPSWTRRPRPK